MIRNSKNNTKKIPDIVIQERLPKYVRALNHLQENGAIESVSSDVLGEMLNCSPALIRKDFSYFGRLGKQGCGYDVSRLLGRLRDICGLDRQWNMALVGVGGLGRAILSYGRFVSQGFKIVAAFDSDPDKIGKRVAGLIIRDMKELADVARKQNIKISIVAVPASQAQRVIEYLERSGIKAILNYAPVTPRTANACVMDIDPVLKLQSLTYFLRQSEPSRK